MSILCLIGYKICWAQTAAQTALVYQDGKRYAQLDLHTTQQLVVQGPLGLTIIETAAGKARILRDPSPRQYCVKQGWLTHAGQIAVCLPNKITLELPDATRHTDSLAY